MTSAPMFDGLTTRIHIWSRPGAVPLKPHAWAKVAVDNRRRRGMGRPDGGVEGETKLSYTFTMVRMHAVAVNRLESGSPSARLGRIGMAKARRGVVPQWREAQAGRSGSSVSPGRLSAGQSGTAVVCPPRLCAHDHALRLAQWRSRAGSRLSNTLRVHLKAGCFELRQVVCA